MAVQFDPIAKDESLNTTELSPRNVADVLAQGLSNIATSISGGSDKVPKTDIATVEPTNVASRAYSIGELVYVNGNLYKVITAISGGATFTVGTNIKSTTVIGAISSGYRETASITVVSTQTWATVLANMKAQMDSSKLKFDSYMVYNNVVCPICNLGGYGSFTNATAYPNSQFYVLTFNFTDTTAALWGSTGGMTNISNSACGINGTMTIYY